MIQSNSPSLKDSNCFQPKQHQNRIQKKKSILKKQSGLIIKRRKSKIETKSSNKKPTKMKKKTRNVWSQDQELEYFVFPLIYRTNNPWLHLSWGSWKDVYYKPMQEHMRQILKDKFKDHKQCKTKDQNIKNKEFANGTDILPLAEKQVKAEIQRLRSTLATINQNIQEDGGQDIESEDNKNEGHIQIEAKLIRLVTILQRYEEIPTDESRYMKNMNQLQANLEGNSSQLSILHKFILAD